MQICLLVYDQDSTKLALAKQMGVDRVVAKLHPDLTGTKPPSDLATLRQHQDRLRDAGLELIGLEGDQMDMTRIKYGLPGREEDVAQYQAMLRNLGDLGIPLLCYNFMVGIGWFRTHAEVPARGGARVSRFRARDVQGKANPPRDPISASQVWDNLTWFLERVLPVAEEAGVRMGLHPDDPPVPDLGGIGRILINAEAFRRVYQIYPSASNAITFCQATFQAMGEDVEALAREFRERFCFIHFRDIKGDREDFTETFHDDGPTDMPSRLKLYHELGFQGPLRPDHTPLFTGESAPTVGYGMQGRLFAIGYIKGIADALRIPLH